MLKRPPVAAIATQLAASRPLAPNRETRLSLLEPPYDHFEAVETNAFGARKPLALGGVICAHGSNSSQVTGLAAVCWRRWPWGIPWIAWADSDNWSSNLVNALLPTCQVILASYTTSCVCARTVFAAAKERPMPSPQLLAAYVQQRTGKDELAEGILEQLEASMHAETHRAPRSVATYSRLFSRYGPFTAHAWRALGLLIPALLRDESKGWRRTTLLTLHRYVSRYLRMSWTSALALVGWEWVLERVLRVGGYVRDQP